MRNAIFCLSMASAILLGGAHTAQANFLAPGSSVLPATVGDTPSGTVLGTATVAFAGSGGLVGTINEAVVKDASTGRLDFLYQVEVTANLSTSAALKSVNFSDFSKNGGVTFGGVAGVDVTQSATSSIGGPFVTGTSSFGTIKSAALASESDQLTASGFTLTGPPTTASYILIVKTDSGSFDANGMLSGGRFPVTMTGIFEPLNTPEPSSMLLLAGTSVGFGLVTWRKRRRAALAS